MGWWCVSWARGVGAWRDALGASAIVGCELRGFTGRRTDTSAVFSVVWRWDFGHVDLRVTPCNRWTDTRGLSCAVATLRCCLHFTRPSPVRMSNRHGLPRSLPADVKREVRQRSRFGCVLCRAAVTQYEHIVPEWHEARVHDPGSICLLCPTHHQMVTSGRLPKSEVMRAYAAIQTSLDPPPPRDDEFFSLYRANARFVLGSCSFSYLSTLIEVDGSPVLRYQPVDGEPPFLIDARIRDASGAALFTIDHNEWIGPTDKWDVEQTGARLVIREGPGQILLDAEKDAVANSLTIRKLNMWWPPFHVLLSPSGLEVGQYSTDLTRGVYLGFHDWQFFGVRAAISLVTVGGELQPSGIEDRGGVGVRFLGTGITIGAGYVQSLQRGHWSARMVALA